MMTIKREYKRKDIQKETIKKITMAHTFFSQRLSGATDETSFFFFALQPYHTVHTACFAWLISHQSAVLFLSEQISHQQPDITTFLSAQISTSHQPPAIRTG
jgi:hypothetical protein